MIRATIEVLPSSGYGKTTLATLDVSNIGGTIGIGDYSCELYGRDIDTRRARVFGFSRTLGAVALVREALNALEEE